MKDNNFNNAQSTRSAWYSATHGGLVKVRDLHTSHLCNIINKLRREVLQKANAEGDDVPTQGEIHEMLVEGCITYPALVVEAKKRGVYLGESKVHPPVAAPLSAPTYERLDGHESQIKMLFAQVAHLEKQAALLEAMLTTNRMDKSAQMELNILRPRRRAAKKGTRKR